MSEHPHGVSLKEHFGALDALRDKYEDRLRVEARRHADQEAAWIKEKFDLHNNLLVKWQEASGLDRAAFVRTAAFDALKEAFGVDKETTSKALTLAEGKKTAYAAMMGVISFLAGVLIASVAVWGALRGFH